MPADVKGIVDTQKQITSLLARMDERLARVEEDLGGVKDDLGGVKDDLSVLKGSAAQIKAGRRMLALAASRLHLHDDDVVAGGLAA